MVSYLAGLLLPVFAGYAVVAWADGRRNSVADCFLRLGLGFGLGWGVSACAYFLTLFFLGPPGKVYFLCESAAFAIVGVWGLISFRCGKPTCHSERSEESQESREILRCAQNDKEPMAFPQQKRMWQRWLLAAFVISVVLAVVAAIGRYEKYPLGDWDAWSIWNQRARFFFRAGDQWREAFGPEFLHTDYPLLLPCGNARLWSYLGGDPSWSPWLAAVLFTFSSFGILTAGLCRSRGRNLGMLAGLMLLGTASFLREGTWQFADVPVGFFMLASALLLVLYDGDEQPHRVLLLLSGLAAAMAGWTKNEGVLFLAVLPAARGLLVWRRDGFKTAAAELLWWIVGALPMVAVIVLQKTCIAANNDLIAGQGFRATMARLGDLSRHAQVAKKFIEVLVRCTWPAGVVLPLLFWMLGQAKDGARGAATVLTTSLLMAAGYYLVCVTTPNNLDWQLDATHRLFMQIWPMCLLGAFLLLGRLDEEAGKSSNSAPTPRDSAFAVK